MGADKYNRPSAGTTDWHEPLNDNFEDIGIEVVGEVETFDDLPDPDGDQTSSNGERRKILVRESRVIYQDAGSGWEPVGGLGTASQPIPGTVHHEGHATGTQHVNGHQLYIQDSEPADADEQDVWIDTS